MKLPITNAFVCVASKLIEQNSYISAIDYSDATSQLCIIIPSGLRVIDCHGLQVTKKLTVNSKNVRLTELKFADENSVMACSSDGFLRLWDLREPDRVSLEMSSTTDPAAELKPLLSCDVNLEGTVACAGSETLKEDAFILFWDLRNTRKLMGGYWDTHSKDVTQVRFHPSAKSFLLTGGVDGLVNVFDIDEACEDDALLYTLNAECAVSSVSWLKRTALDVDRLAIVTSEEEFQWWEADDAEPKFRRTREKLVEGNAGDNKIVVDHLVGMVTFDDGLSTLVSSSNDGKVELWTEAGVHLASLAASHHDLVRAAVAGRDETGQQKSLWTAGEDGIVCYWKEGAQCAGVAAKDFKAGSSIKTKSKLHKAKPY